MKQDIFIIGESMVKSINKYHIHFNKNMFNDINYRNFETIGTGTVLLTDYKSDYEILGFINNENCLMYNNMDDIRKIIGRINNNLIDLKNIGNNGYNLSKTHTYKVRVKKLIDQLWKK
jgi:spore maturation protein CgeB